MYRIHLYLVVLCSLVLNENFGVMSRRNQIAGHSWRTRPDLTCRLYFGKHIAYISEVTDGKIFSIPYFGDCIRWTTSPHTPHIAQLHSALRCLFFGLGCNYLVSTHCHDEHMPETFHFTLEFHFRYPYMFLRKLIEYLGICMTIQTYWCIYLLWEWIVLFGLCYFV